MWIAFRIQYLWYQQQLSTCELIYVLSCELLSEFSIFDTNNNPEDSSLYKLLVVNCFQNSVSLIPTTTSINNTVNLCALWIAFRIQYLWYQQQQIGAVNVPSTCCELLSEFSIFDTNNNLKMSLHITNLVVNCFQNSVSLIPTTTSLDLWRVTCWLWIAFRIQYLWYQQQPMQRLPYQD